METKPWYRSRMLWVNTLTLVVSLLQGEYGTIPWSSETVVWILGILNILLRIFATPTALTWTRTS